MNGVIRIGPIVVVALLLIAVAAAGRVDQFAAQEGEASTSTASTLSAPAKETGDGQDVGPRTCHGNDPFEFECEFTVSFGSSSYSVDEGSSVTITVNMSPAADQTFTIPVTVSPGNNTSVKFTSTQSSRTFSYSAGQDTNCDDESVSLGFDTGALPSAVVAGSPSSATVTIRDDDDDCTVDPPPPPSPPAPTGLTHTSVGTSWVALSWSTAFQAASTSTGSSALPVPVGHGRRSARM